MYLCPDLCFTEQHCDWHPLKVSKNSAPWKERCAKLVFKGNIKEVRQTTECTWLNWIDFLPLENLRKETSVSSRKLLCPECLPPVEWSKASVCRKKWSLPFCGCVKVCVWTLTLNNPLCLTDVVRNSKHQISWGENWSILTRNLIYCGFWRQPIVFKIETVL